VTRVLVLVPTRELGVQVYQVNTNAYKKVLLWYFCSVSDPGSGAFLPPGSGMNFFPDLGSRIFFTKIKILLLKAKEARKK
jgi:hypothetical protein